MQSTHPGRIFKKSIHTKKPLQIACFSYQVHELFVVPGIPHVPCTLVASLLYYSGTSARLWWLCTCAAWRWSIRSNNKKAVLPLLIIDV
jgi:hypothetical protein